MFSFANPGLLYLLLLVPVMVGLFLLARMARKRKLERYGNLSILAPLMPDASVYKPWIRLTLQLIALSALVIAVARPRFVEKEETERSEGIEVMIAMDVSRAMLASSSDDPSGV